MNKVIVTGANGFVGRYLVTELLNQNIKVIAIVRKGKAFEFNHVNSNLLTVIGCDLDEYGALDQEISDRDFDAFYHLAWSGSAGQARIDEKLQLQNVLWTVDAVRVAHKLGCKRFVGAGSIMETETYKAVYAQGNKLGMAYIYGQAKQTAHSISKSVAVSLGIEHVWGMITNAYGPNEISPRFINTTLRKIINGESLEFTAGTQNYDFVYVEDVAKALFTIGKSGKAFKHYIIGSGNAKPLKKFVLEIKEYVGQMNEFKFGDVPFTGVNLALEDFDNDELRSDTGFAPGISFETGIRNTFDWLKGQ